MVYRGKLKREASLPYNMPQDVNYDLRPKCSERQLTRRLLGASCGILRSVPIKVRNLLASTVGWPRLVLPVQLSRLFNTQSPEVRLVWSQVATVLTSEGYFDSMVKP
jgi:hypothetical protein